MKVLDSNRSEGRAVRREDSDPQSEAWMEPRIERVADDANVLVDPFWCVGRQCVQGPDKGAS